MIFVTVVLEKIIIIIFFYLNMFIMDNEEKGEYKVMNNIDLRKKIWSYLRKDAKVRCIKCNRVCVWDNKIIITIYNLDPLDIDNKDYICKYCNQDEYDYNCYIL